MTIKINLEESCDDIVSLTQSLIYLNYKFNRYNSPHLTPEQWGKVFGAEQVEEMEKLFQAEKGPFK